MHKLFRLTLALVITISTLSVSGSVLAQDGTPTCDPNAVCFDVILYPAGITADFYINGQMVAQNVNATRLVGKKDSENIAEARNIKDNLNQGFGDLYTYADIKTPIYYSTYFYPVLNYVKGTLQINVASTSYDAIVGDLFVDGVQAGTQVVNKNVNVLPGKHVVEVKNVVDPKAGGKYKYDNAMQETFVNLGPYGAYVYLYLNRNWLSGFLAVTCVLNGKGFNDDARCAINENGAKIDVVENYSTSNTSLSSGVHNVSVTVIGTQANKWGTPISSTVTISSTPYGPGTTYLTAAFDLKPNAPDTNVAAATLTLPESIKFSIDNGTSATDVEAIQKGIAIVHSYLDITMGGDATTNWPNLTVSIFYANSNVSCCLGLTASNEPGPRFYTLHSDWVNRNTKFPGNLFLEHQKHSAHEYTHSWQGAIGCLGGKYGKPLGTWLTEGMAEYVAWNALVQTGQLTREQVTQFHIALALSQGSGQPDFPSWESNRAWSWWAYPYAYLAVEKLVAENGGPIILRKLCDEAAKVAPVTNIQDYLNLAIVMKNLGIDKEKFYNELGPGASTLIRR